MSQYTDGPTKAFLASGALDQFLRVKTPTSLALAGAIDIELGTMEEPTFAALDHGTVRLRSASGTRKMVASEAIGADVTVFAAASGKVATTGAIAIGTSMEAASANNSIFEVLPFSATIVQPTVTQSVTPDDSESALNQIVAGVTAVDVGAVTNDANDFIVLPALADVPNGHLITVLCNAGGNFELRTPAASAEEINSEDCDGTKEYLCTNTQVLKEIGRASCRERV